MRKLFFISILGYSFFGCFAPKNATINTGSEELVGIGFYNVENLFDTIDQPIKHDEEFTPTGRNKWNTLRYYKKLDQLSRVIEAMDFPAILGVCEIENATVLKDLAENDRLRSYKYKFLTFESPDFRGIDNALLYQPDKFEVTSSKVIRIDFPESIVKDYTTRDILVVGGKLLGQRIHFLINHFPSRRGGLEASEPKRIYVAKQLKAAVDSIEALGSPVCIMGDFNDEPLNKSIFEVLGTGATKGKHLYNLFLEKDRAGEGTYNYRGNWNLLDQIIVSPDCRTKSNGIYADQPKIVKEAWMLYKSPKYGYTPSRTYGGPNYYGGFSDHLPVRATLHVLN